MKVLHTIASLDPKSGGPTFTLIQMVQTLKTFGIESEIATTNAGLNHFDSIPGVPVRYFNAPFWKKYGFSSDLLRWMKRHIQDYEIVHIHGVFCYTALVSAYAANQAGVPYVVRPGGELDAWSLQQNAFLKKMFLGLFGTLILQRSAAIHAMSETERKEVEKLRIKNLVATIPHGLPSISTSSSISGGEFRKLYPSIGRRKLILFLSRIHPKKGLEILLQSIKKLLESRNDFVLVVAGSGSGNYEVHIQREIRRLDLSRHVVLCGFLQGKEKWEVLRDADLFVLPSYDENFGLAIVEAMSFGLPVLVSDWVGIHSLISEYQAGLVTPCNFELVAANLNRLLDDDSLRKHLGENGKRLVKNRFSCEKEGSELVKMYQGILKMVENTAS